MARQKFKSRDNTPLASLQTHPCGIETEERYLVWTDIQHTFSGVDHLETNVGERALFTIGSDDSRWQPLRIQYTPEDAYTVIYKDNQNQQIERHFDTLQESDGHVQRDSRSQEQEAIQPRLKPLFDTCEYLYQYLKSVANKGSRDTFYQAVANFRYTYSTMREEIERLDKAGNTLVDGKDLKQILEELCDLENQMSEWVYLNTCQIMLFDASVEWDFSTSLFFIVLPSNLDAQDSLDPSAHHFRLYYMCDNWKQPRSDSAEDVPQHVHLSNHPGYSIKRPVEFFQVYGDYVLRVLQMVKRGYSNDVYEIPPVDTFRILWSYDSTAGGLITEDTLGPLLDKAITYLQKLSPPKWTSLALDRTRSAAIKTYLDIQGDDNAEGNLHSYISSNQLMLWMCQAHAQQYSNLESLRELREFVCDHEGYINMQQGKLGVELGSVTEADQFRTLLLRAKHVFRVYVKLCWRATRSYVEEICHDVARTGTLVLELEGITLDINPQGCGEYTHNLFDTDVLRETKLKLIMLVNYPRPQQQCIHIRGVSIQSISTPIRPLNSWVMLSLELERIQILMFNTVVEVESNAAARELKAVLKKHGLPIDVEVTVYGEGWSAVIDQESDTVVKVQSQDMVCPKGILSTESIRSLGIHLDDLGFEPELFQIVRSKMLLQDLSVSYHSHDVLYIVEHLVKMWHASASLFRLTLLDRMLDTQGRVFAQLAISRGDSDTTRSTAVDISGCGTNLPLFQEQVMDSPLDIVLLQWDCDHVFSQLSDYFTSFLNMVAQQHPSTITSFTLDISRLSSVGLASVQEVLRRSSLEHLNIVCTSLRSNQANEVTQILGSVQWYIIKSLVLSGNNIDKWCRLWPSPVIARLLSLHINGSPSAILVLSHPSTLFLQQLIFSSPLAELHFRNMLLQDERDWVLVVDSMDLSFLQTLDLGEHGFAQFLSVLGAVELFDSRLEEAHLEVERPKLVLPSFTLDIANLPQTSLTSVQTFLSLCLLEKLVLDCSLLNPHISDAVPSALDHVQWTMLESLTLSGENISQWIQLLANNDTPHLRTLHILGTNLVQQELSHASVLFVERLISASSLKELCFKDVVLQDQHDWILLVKVMDSSMMDNFVLGEGSYAQFMSTPDAVDLKHSKRKQWRKEQGEEDSEEDSEEDY